MNIHQLSSILIKFYNGRWGNIPNGVCLPSDYPKSLIEFYAMFGTLIDIEPSEENEHRPPFSSQDYLLHSNRLIKKDGYVVIASENQGNWSCRVPTNSDDPFIESNADSLFESKQHFEVLQYKLSEFLETIALQEAVMSARYLYSIDSDEDPSTFPSAKTINTSNKYVHKDFRHKFAIIGDDVILMNFGCLWIGSNVIDFRSMIPKKYDFQQIHG